MKTSDKILLIGSLSSLGLLGVIHLALYAEYRRGDIVTEKGLHTEQFRRIDMPAPDYVCVRGLLRVNIIPSDTFYIEFEKAGQHTTGATIILKGGDPSRVAKPTYRNIGDSLVITGPNGVTINRHINSRILWDFPRVNIYCRHLKRIFLENGQTILEGDKIPGDLAVPITAKDGIVWVGQSGGWEGTQNIIHSYFDSLSFHMVNCTLLLNENASIRSLQVDLDDQSEIDDQHAVIEKPLISGTDRSHINLTGTTLKKLLLQQQSTH